MQNIFDNLSQVHSLINQECIKNHRSIDEVTLLCVSKTKPIEMIKAAYSKGERHFGESYALEAVSKIETLKAEGFTDIIWHFIGPIQSNKTKYIASHFDIVESVDRVKILDRLNEQRTSINKTLKVMLQVNISNEEQKQGCSVEELPNLLEHASSLDKIEVIGLMGVAKDQASDKEISDSFNLLKDLRNQYQERYPLLKELSMGMTNDLALAIACGSSEIRIGSAIFGAREYIKK